MQTPATERGRYLPGLVAAVIAVLVLAGSLLVADRNNRNDRNDRNDRNNPRLEQALGELIEDARGLASGRGVYTEVGSRERIDRLEQSASQRWADRRPGVRRSSSPGMPVCAVDGDCHHPRGVCDVATGLCRCVVAYAGVRCDRVVHVAFTGSGAYGKMLPLDVLDERERELYGAWGDEEGEDEEAIAYPVERVEERCVVGAAAAAAARQSGVGREIARRLVERFWAREFQDEGDETKIKQKDDARGDVVALLEAMRRCLDVEVEAHTTRRGAGHPGGNEAIRWLMTRLADV